MKPYLIPSIQCSIFSRSPEVHFCFYSSIQIYGHVAEFTITEHYFTSKNLQRIFPYLILFFPFSLESLLSAPIETLNHEGLCASFLLKLFRTSKNLTDYSMCR